VSDGRGRRYLVWKKMGVGNGIYGARLSASGRELISEPQRLTLPDEPWEEGVTEGPDIVRNGDAFVLVYSGGHCCRPPCTYAVGVARASSILGPYTKDPANPVFHGGNGWKCPGHGTLVDGPGGELTFLHHAYAESDPFDVHRQALLDPVVFGGDGWPAFGAGGAPVGPGTDGDQQRLVDAFAGHALAPGWQWPYNGAPRVRVGGGVLRVLRGEISRAWVPRDFVAEAQLKGAGRLSVLLTDGRRIGVGAVRGTAALALHVRAGRAVAAYRRRAGGRWRRVGALVLAPSGIAVDRVALGRGVFGQLRLRPLGKAR
jgi:hypothetical protein